MTIRTTLLANITTALTGTSVSVSSELPFECGGTPGYLRNMKTFYLDSEETDITTIIATLGSDDVFQTEVIIVGYFAIDAKRLPSDLNTILTGLFNARLSITGQMRNDCNISSEIDQDRIIYTIRYRFLTIN